jgi:NAD(P)H-hydrate repair Nnr-like enzyme with NAD(P)H-hydrate dehydratase domain
MTLKNEMIGILIIPMGVGVLLVLLKVSTSVLEGHTPLLMFVKNEQMAFLQIQHVENVSRFVEMGIGIKMRNEMMETLSIMMVEILSE